MHVTGTGDFHHQWGFFPAVATGTFGWNVITFALRDGRDITLFDGSAPGHDKTFTADSGFISNAQGGVRLLHHSDFAITPTRFWHRDSDCSYPVDWNVRVRTGTGWLDLHTDAKVDSAELRATGHPEAYVVAANYTGYWDGPTSVGGDASGEGWLDTGHYCSTTSDLPPDTLAILGPEGSNPSTPVPLTPVALPGRGLPKVADVSTLGPDGAIWFDEAMSNKIGRITPAGAITEFALPHAMSAPVGITKGPDGAVWFTEWLGDRIGRITTSGAISEFPVPQGAGPGGIATGRDGAIWFTESRSDKIGRLTTDGTLTEYPLPQRGAFADDMRAGSDSAIWFTEAAANKIGRITLSGHLTEFRVPTPASWPFAIAPGPDNAMWFVETFGNKLGRVGCHGKITEVQLPQPLSGPGDIAVGPDRALWFPEIAGNRIGRLGRSGNLTEFPVPTVGGAPFALTAGSDGNLWFPELGANKIGRITITGQVTEYPLPS
jgi:virginiamycin B lyase